MVELVLGDSPGALGGGSGDTRPEEDGR
jgi:multicomponent Na+:H+ antiporter subunit D